MTGAAPGVAERVAYPVLVRPSYVLGGRNMVVCYDEPAVRNAALEGVRTLVDHFLESAVEIDVDAVSDGDVTWVAAVMQHVEEAGVHSGDSSCVLPAQGISPAIRREIEDVVCRLARALGVVGVVNVQLAVADGEVFVLEVNPRASRTLPFASKAIGVNLVDAGCRVAAGTRLADLDIAAYGSQSDAARQVSVKAAVLPFIHPGRRPGAGPGSALVRLMMASASVEARSRRPSGRRAGRFPAAAPRSCRFATPTRRQRFRSRLRSPGWASRWWPPRARPGRSRRLAFRSSASARWGRLARATRWSTSSAAGVVTSS